MKVLFVAFDMPHHVSGINIIVLSVKSTSFRSVCLSLACSCSYHVFSLCQLTALTINNSLSLSLPAQDLRVSQIFRPQDRLNERFEWTVLLSISAFCL